MTQDTQLAVREQGAMTLQDTISLGKILAESGFFPEARSAAQAVAKILTGREVGIGPMASLMGIVIIQGKPEFQANLQAALVKASGRYDYRVVALTPERCELAFYQDGQEIGRSVFTLDDAKRAGTKNLDRFPRNMLFARAMSNGVKWYCPDVTKGIAAYAPGELPFGDVEARAQTLEADVIDAQPAPSPTVGERVLAQSVPVTVVPSKDGDGDGDRAQRGCTVSPRVTEAWRKAVGELAASEPHYQDGNGNPNWPHIRNAAYALSFSMVTPDNLESVIDALRTHAHERERAAQVEAGQQELPL